MMAGILYSFGVFFKPLAADFGCERATISGIYSILMVSQGIFALPTGWLADRFGPAKIVAICGFFIGLGLILTSYANALWQLYLTYGFMVGIGISGGFSITTATTARWFYKHQGLALGIVSAGVGLGTLIMLPVAERLIAAFDWPRAYFVIGLAAWVIIITSALFLRRDPEEMGCRPYGVREQLLEPNTDHTEKKDTPRSRLVLVCGLRPVPSLYGC